ncbi:MAG TPA: hypothetical protein VNE62_02670 [Actinomycetota bacterium]|nr:hypothetical protein [Actinomycetota bacterium]
MRRRIALAGAALWLAAVSAAPPATALEPDAYGWWWKVQQGPVPVPAPPAVPADGLYVAADGTDEQMAVAGLRFDAEDGDFAVLELKAATHFSTTDAVILACPTTSQWQVTSPGAWGSRPLPECGITSAFGRPLAGGAAMSWELGAEFQTAPGLWNLLLIPLGKTPFQVAFAAPGPDALDIQAAGSAETPTDPPQAVIEETGTTGTFVTDFTGATFALPDFPAVPQPISGQQPRAAGPVPAPPPGGIPPVRRTSGNDDRTARAAAAAILLAGSGFLAWASSQSPRSPRLLGSLSGGRGAAQTIAVETGGIGRFARPRATPPRRL